MRNIAIAVVVAGTLGGCRKPAPDPAQPKGDLTGNWRWNNDGNADFIEVELKADGTYFMDTGLRCKKAPCPSTFEGKWTLDSARKLTIGEHAYDADLKLAPKKQLRLRRHEGRDGDREATFDSVPR